MMSEENDLMRNLMSKLERASVERESLLAQLKAVEAERDELKAQTGSLCVGDAVIFLAREARKTTGRLWLPDILKWESSIVQDISGVYIRLDLDGARLEDETPG